VTYFWLLLLSHGLADFVFQTDSISSAKCDNQWQGYLRHGLIVFLCTFAAIHFYGWGNALLSAMFITVIHTVLDWLKNTSRTLLSKLRNTQYRPGVPGLLLDQALHIFTLLWAWHILDRPVNNAIATFYSAAFAPTGDMISMMDKIIPVLAIYVLTAFGGAVLVRMSLDQLFPTGELRGETSAGKYIGILERILILTLTASGNLTSVGFVFTAKSIARFNEIADHRQFAEYYLVGTLVSFALALAGGLILLYIL